MNFKYSPVVVSDFLAKLGLGFLIVPMILGVKYFILNSAPVEVPSSILVAIWLFIIPAVILIAISVLMSRNQFTRKIKTERRNAFRSQS